MWHDWVVLTSHQGRLLVATPHLLDPNFYRTVVLLLQHDEEGTVGVVLNRPTIEAVADHLPEWGEVVADPGVIHYGGPVEPQVAIGLARTEHGLPTGVPGLSVVDLASTPPADGPRARVYGGYAGWGEGQLEDELTTGSWFLVPAGPDDPFDDPEAQWQTVLRRQGGLLAVVSTFPEDPTLN
ncbi:MAG: YqgE/AlgH family protein [Actinobacteria bacterium]|nr:YqgE/AlgH family protein [Actinomycetota bacterium]